MSDWTHHITYHFIFMANGFFCKLAEARLMSKGTQSEKSAKVLLWVCGGTLHTFLNALCHATHKSLTANP